MNKSWLLNSALLAVVMILVLLAVLEPGKKAEHDMHDAPRLTRLQADSIRRIRIEAGGQAPVVLEKAPDAHWYLREPLQLAANEFKLEGLLKIVEARSAGQITKVEADLAQFGLAPPKAVLTLGQHRFEFGDSTPLNAQRYVKTGAAIHLVADNFYYKLIGGAMGWAHLSPLGAEPKITEIHTDTYHILKADGTWRHAEAGRPAADFAETVAAWEQAQAFQVRAYVPLAEGESSMAAAVRLDGAEAPLEFEIRAGKDELVLANPRAGVMYDVPSSRTAGLLNLVPAPGGGEG